MAKDHPASLGMTCGQNVEYPSRCCLSRPGLPLQINSYPNFSQYWVGTDLNCRRSNPGPLRARQWFYLCVLTADENIMYSFKINVMVITYIIRRIKTSWVTTHSSCNQNFLLVKNSRVWIPALPSLPFLKKWIVSWISYNYVTSW